MKRRYRDQVVIFHTIADAMRHTNLVVHAAPARDIIRSDVIAENTMISAPAVPLGLTKGALRRLNSQNLIHDPLQLGVAAMAVEACLARKRRRVA
jgi:pyrrolysine biosynthesis protein PylD